MKLECIKKEQVYYSIECKVKKYCCKKMEQVFNEKYEMCHRDGSGSFSITWILDKCGIRVPIRASDYSNIVYEHINYCPFCGEEIDA